VRRVVAGFVSMIVLSLAGAFCPGAEPSDVIDMRVGDATCRVDTLGGRVLSYRVAGSEVLWTQDGRPPADAEWWHGGIPLCWPSFGRRTDASVHGIAWKSRLQVVSRAEDQRRSEVTLRMRTDVATLDYRLSLSASGLQLVMTTQNDSESPLSIAWAMHPYFSVGNRDAVTIRGVGKDVLALNRAINADFSEFAPSCEIDDPIFGRQITLEWKEVDSVGIWNPGAEAKCAGVLPVEAWKSFVCVEPRVGVLRPLVLPVGGSRKMTMTVKVCEVKGVR